MASSWSRVRPKRSRSISGSHSRNRGHARVQMSHPLSPWVHWSGPRSSSWMGWSFSYPRTWKGQTTTQAEHPVQSPVATTSLWSSRHWTLGPLSLATG